VDCYEEDREEHTYTDVQGAPGPTPDFGCLLDPIWGAPTGPGLPYDFMLFWSPALGARCYVLRSERVMRQFGYTQIIPTPPVDSWVSYDDIHDRWMHYSDHMILPHFASFHDTRPGLKSSARWSCSAAPSHPSGPRDRYPSRAGARSTIDICEAHCGRA